MAICRRSPGSRFGDLALAEHAVVDELGLQLVGRDPTVELERQVDAGVGAEAEQADLVLQLRAGGVM